MVNFTDKLVMSINDTQTLSTDVIYFDGSLLKFLMNYLGEREQSVVLDGIKSFSKPVLSY